MTAETAPAPLVPIGPLGAPGQVVVVGPQWRATTELDVVVDGEAVARSVDGEDGHQVLTADGSWTVETSWRDGVRLLDAGGTELAVADTRLTRRARRGHVEGTAVHWRPAGVWTRDGRWTDADGRVVADVRARGVGRHTITMTFGPGAVPGRPMLLLVALTRHAVADRIPVGIGLFTDLVSGWS